MLTLLTMTGERPEAFKLCQKWMSRQTYKGKVRWVIVDDGRTPSEVANVNSKWNIEIIRPEPFWHPGQNTQARNILAGLDVINTDEKLVIIEDDDWYSPKWLETIDSELEKAELVGETHARYYNVSSRKAKRHDNRTHSSLCSSAMRGDAIRTLRSVCRPGIQFIDILLWQAHSNNYLFDGSGVVGIKGLPGRAGIGNGHSSKFNGKHDAKLEILNSWIGKDVKEYFPLEKVKDEAPTAE